MKPLTLAAMLLVILRGASVLANFQPFNCAFSQNPYLRYLSSNQVQKVQMHEYPVFDSNRCGSEWSKFGTCCNTQDLILYAEKDASRINAYSERLRGLMATYSTVFSSLLSDLSAIDKKDIHGKGQKALLMKALASLSQTNFHRALRDLATRLDKKAAFNSCWNKMAEIRSNSLCSTCSGRSLVFFRENKGVISDSSCSSIIASCKHTFEIMVEFMQGIDAISEQFKDTSPRSQHLAKELTMANQEASKNQIQRTIKKLVSGGYSDPAAEDFVCSKFVRLGGRTFVEKMYEILNIDTSLFERVRDSLGSRRLLSKQPRKLLKADWSLSTNTEERPPIFEGGLFEGDVYVVPPQVESKVDSAYASTFGAAGTGLNVVASWMRVIPMNMSRAFP